MQSTRLRKIISSAKSIVVSEPVGVYENSNSSTEQRKSSRKLRIRMGSLLLVLGIQQQPCKSLSYSTKSHTSAPRAEHW